MKSVFIFSCLVAVTLGFSSLRHRFSRYRSGSDHKPHTSIQHGYSRGHFGGLVVSKRATTSGSQNVYDLIEDVLERARQGIKAADLETAASQIETEADSAVDALGGTVSEQDTQDVIDEVSATFDGATAVSALFDDPLNYEASKMDAALSLLNGLNNKAQAEEASGNSPGPALAAISMTADAIQTIVNNTVTIVTYVVEANSEEAKTDAKRWKFEGGYKHGPGGDSYNIGISHKWGGKRRVRSFSRRGGWTGGLNGAYDPGKGYNIGGSVSYKHKGFSAGLNAGYSSMGGLGVGASLSYSWGRRR